MQGGGEHEWEAQERGAEAPCRLIARVLADPPLDPIPTDFARTTADLARRERIVRTGIRARALQAVLWAGLLLAGVATLAVYGDRWRLAASAAQAGDGAIWTAAIGGCVLLTVLVQIWAQPGRAPLARG